MLFVDLLLLLVTAAAVLWPPLVSGAIRKEDTDWYECERKKSKRLRCSPNARVFAPIWCVLFGLIVSAALVCQISIAALDIVSYLQVILGALFFCNLSLLHHWPVAFFARRKFRLAAFVLFLVLVTGIATVVFFGVLGYWISFGLYMPYVLWCFYALWLNIKWLCVGKQPKIPRSDEGVCCDDDSQMPVVTQQPVFSSAVMFR